VMPSIKKKERQKLLKEYIEKEPFVTDEDLAKFFKVSIQTIRLDRLALGIPQLRERIQSVAVEAYEPLRSLQENELVGDLIDIQLEKEGLSILDIAENMVFSKTQIARGHHLFAQANSLAVATIDAEVALTGSARVRYIRPVLLGERVIAKASIKVKKKNKYLVEVISKVHDELVFKGLFIVFATKY
jgi:acyl-coenzyme A thioesterase PaaI-like protein